jgi:dihydroneopterin aldolase
MLKLLIKAILNKFKTIEPVVQEVTETKKPAVKKPAAKKVAVKKPAAKKVAVKRTVKKAK